MIQTGGDVLIFLSLHVTFVFFVLVCFFCSYVFNQCMIVFLSNHVFCVVDCVDSGDCNTINTNQKILVLVLVQCFVFSDRFCYIICTMCLKQQGTTKLFGYFEKGNIALTKKFGVWVLVIFQCGLSNK